MRRNYAGGYGQHFAVLQAWVMSLHVISQPAEIGAFAQALRRYRTARRMSQLHLALACGVSARHVSFLETGRALPSRDMVLQLAAGLVVPLGAQNALLQAAGFAPVYPASALDSDALGPFRAVLTEMMARHAPNPALLCDRHWNMRDANVSAQALLAPLAEDGEINMVRMLARSPKAEAFIANYPEVLEEMSARIQLESLEAGDDLFMRELMDDLDRAIARHPQHKSGTRRTPLVPIVLNAPGGQLSFLSAIAHFGTSEDVTVRDLRLELLFPADAQTRAAMAAFAT